MVCATPCAHASGAGHRLATRLVPAPAWAAGLHQDDDAAGPLQRLDEVLRVLEAEEGQVALPLGPLHRVALGASLKAPQVDGVQFGGLADGGGGQVKVKEVANVRPPK